MRTKTIRMMPEIAISILKCQILKIVAMPNQPPGLMENTPLRTIRVLSLHSKRTVSLEISKVRMHQSKRVA